MSLKETLLYLQGSAGINWLIGFAWSYLMELIPGLKDWFSSLSAVGKRVVIALFSLLVPLGAFGLKLAFGFEVFSIDNLWRVFVAWAMAFFGSQAAHTIGPRHPARLSG